MVRRAHGERGWTCRRRGAAEGAGEQDQGTLEQAGAGHGQALDEGWEAEVVRQAHDERGEVEARQEVGQEQREAGGGHWGSGCGVYSGSVPYLGTSGKW